MALLVWYNLRLLCSLSWFVTWLKDRIARIAMGRSAQETNSTKIWRATLLRRNVESTLITTSVLVF